MFNLGSACSVMSSSHHCIAVVLPGQSFLIKPLGKYLGGTDFALLCLCLEKTEIKIVRVGEFDCHTQLCLNQTFPYIHNTQTRSQRETVAVIGCLGQSIGNQPGGYVTVVTPFYPYFEFCENSRGAAREHSKLKSLCTHKVGRGDTVVQG